MKLLVIVLAVLGLTGCTIQRHKASSYDLAEGLIQSCSDFELEITQPSSHTKKLSAAQSPAGATG